MNTATCTPLPLHRPWLRRLAADLWHRLRAKHGAGGSRADDEYAALAGLSEATLRDIGAPDSVHERDRALPLWTLERARW